MFFFKPASVEFRSDDDVLRWMVNIGLYVDIYMVLPYKIGISNA